MQDVTMIVTDWAWTRVVCFAYAKAQSVAVRDIAPAAKVIIDKALAHEGPGSRVHLVALPGKMDRELIIDGGEILLDFLKRDYADAPDAVHRKYVQPGADDAGGRGESL